MNCMPTTAVYTAKQPAYCAASPQPVLSDYIRFAFTMISLSLLNMDYSHRKMDEMKKPSFTPYID